MRILITGCHRSGTTALFNLVRVSCEQRGRVYGCFHDEYRGEAGGQCDFEIVKVHKFSMKWVQWADIVFTIFREPADVWESMQRFNPDRFTNDDLLRGLAWFGLYNFYAAECFYFNQLRRAPGHMIKTVSRTLGIKINTAIAENNFRDIEPPKTGIDPITLLHSNHITQ